MSRLARTAPNTLQSPSPTPRRGRGRPRDEGLEHRVLEAAVHELAQYGVDSFSLRRTAHRAGVSKASVYLRWAEPQTLILDTLEHLSVEYLGTRTGTLVGDLRELIAQLQRYHEGPALNVMLHFVANSQAYPQLYARYQREILEPRVKVMREVIERAQATGEISRSLDAEAIACLLMGGVLLESVSAAGRRLTPKRLEIFTQTMLELIVGRTPASPLPSATKAKPRRTSR